MQGSSRFLQVKFYCCFIRGKIRIWLTQGLYYYLLLSTLLPSSTIWIPLEFFVFLLWRYIVRVYDVLLKHCARRVPAYCLVYTKVWLRVTVQELLRIDMIIVFQNHCVKYVLDLLLFQPALTKFWCEMSLIYPNVADRAVKTLLMFPSTYLCEQGFSALLLI